MQQKLMSVMNWMAYLFFTGVWGVAYLFYRGYVLFVLFLVLLLLIPISIGAVLYLRNRVTAECFFDKRRTLRGESFSVTFSLNNPTYLASKNVFLEIVLENPYAEKTQSSCVVMPLRAKKRTEVSLKCSGTCCGRLSCRVTRVGISDWFGLVNLAGKQVEEAAVFILPKRLDVCELPEREGTREGEQEIVLEDKKGVENSEVISFRDYVPGDRQQNIHWKLSAKAEGFLVKEYGYTVNNEIAMLLDLKRGPLNDVLELFFSVGSSLCMRGQQFQAIYMENGEFVTESVTSEARLEEVLEHIYDGLPAKNSVVPEYKVLYPEGEGTTLLVGREAGIPASDGLLTDVYMRHGEAVAAWI